jgi:1,4-alpha-glucan branching enzyme
VPHGGRWVERVNSDAADYGGSGQGNLGALDAAQNPSHGHPFSLHLRLPPLAVVVLTPG